MTLGPTERSFVLSALGAALFALGMFTGRAFGRPVWAMDRTTNPVFFWMFQILWGSTAGIFAALGIWGLFSS
jgi:hypothetical protein